MKKKISKIWGVGLVLVLVASLLLAAAPVSAATCQVFTDESLPSATGLKLGPAGVDVLDLAVANDGTTIYAACGAPAGRLLYKSTDAGETWSNLSATTGLTITNTDFVACAPDDPDWVVVADGTAGSIGAWASTNGGSSWGTLGTIQDVAATAATAIYDAAMSPSYSGKHYIALAGTDAVLPLDDADNAPAVYYFVLGDAAPSWKDAVLNFTTPLVVGQIDAMKAVEFSPNFASDNLMVVVSEEIGTAAKVSAARFHMASFTCKCWDAVGGFTGYPVALETTLATQVTTMVEADISLAPDYFGADESLRLAFVGLRLDDNTAGADLGGIYRLSDTSLKDMKNAAIKSVAYDGTNLVAGATTNQAATTSNAVYRSADPLATSPSVKAARTYKKPGGVTEVVVEWAGANVVAGTTGDESAFAVSTDNGLSFVDVSLIDTVLDVLSDVWVTPDGTKVYLLSDDSTTEGVGAGDLSVWRRASSWIRVLSIQAPGAIVADPYKVRGAPENNDAVYVFKQNDMDIYRATDAGEHKWSYRSACVNIQDLAVESTEVAYTAEDASVNVRKSTNGAFSWSSAKSSKLKAGNIHMIACIAEDQVIAGGDNTGATSQVAYSADGNASWTSISPALNANGNVQVTASGLDTDGYIYASTDAAAATTGVRIERWKIGTNTTAWSNMSAATTTDVDADGNDELWEAFGIALKNGVLYVACEDGQAAPANAASAIFRTLSPTASPTSAAIWSRMDQDANTFLTQPTALRVSDPCNTLWVIDTVVAFDLVSYYDELACLGITALSPPDGFSNTMCPGTCAANDIAFTWEKPCTSVTDYDIRVYTDAAGTVQILANQFASTASTVARILGPNQPAGQTIQYTPGTTYYWRVRVAQAGPTYSPWSAMRKFTIEPAVAQQPIIQSPANGGTGIALTPAFSWSPVSGATKYEFALAVAPFAKSFATPVASATVAETGIRPIVKLNYDMTYFWKVRAVAPVAGPWSTVSNFTTLAEPVEPAPPAPPVVVQQVPAPIIQMPPQPAAPAPIVIPPQPAPITPAYIWAIIIIGAILVIAVVVLIVRTRRPV